MRDERALAKDKDLLLKWALATIWLSVMAFLVYINNCQQQIMHDNGEIKASMAMLMERTLALKADVSSLKSDNAFQQQEIDELRATSHKN